MRTQSEHNDSVFFVVAALWNWLISLVLFFFGNSAFRMLGMEELNYPITLQLFMSLVFAFGIGYFMVSRDLHSNRGLLVAAIFGKVMVFLVIVYHVLVIKTIAPVLVILGLGDAIFAVFFVKFLIGEKRKMIDKKKAQC
jgi:hypothetical protein